MFDWRRKKTKAGKKQKPKSSDQLVIPNHFLCPISLELMKDPVTVSSGMTYDRESIEKWLEAGNFTCPVTNLMLRSFDQVPNHSLRKMIQEWCVENQRHGVERVPTPRIPVTSAEVSEILFGITALVNCLDQCGCLDLLNKIKKWGFESERNRRCIVVNGTAAVLASAFDAFARDFEKNENVLEEILAALNWMFPLDNDSKTLLITSQDSLRCLVLFLKNSNKHLSAKQDAILLLQELISCQYDYTEALQMADTGVNEVLFSLIKHPTATTSHTITKASIMIIYAMVSNDGDERIKSAFVEMGLVSLLLNLLIDSERAICEVGLGVVDALCDCTHGRDEAYENVLTVPVLVKKILRVSDLATEYSVSAIWKLSKFEKKHQDRILFEGLQVGIFQKLVLLLQCGCGDMTKEKATELLKLLNPYRPGLECIESADFKSLQRSF